MTDAARRRRARSYAGGTRRRSARLSPEQDPGPDPQGHGLGPRRGDTARVQGAGRALLRGALEKRRQPVTRPECPLAGTCSVGRESIRRNRRGLMNVKSTIQWATPYSLGLLLALAVAAAGWLRAPALGLGPADRARPPHRAAGHPAGDPGDRRPDHHQPRAG